MSIFVTAVLILSKGTLVQKQGKRVENENRPIEATTFEEVGTRLSYLINRVHPPCLRSKLLLIYPLLVYPNKRIFSRRMVAGILSHPSIHNSGRK